MVKALAPRWFHRDSWGVFALALGMTFSATATLHAQTEKKAADTSKNAAPADPLGGGEADDIAVKLEGQGVVDTLQMKKQESLEQFKDARTEKASANTYPELPYPPARALTASDQRSLESMASGLQTPDRTLIAKAIDIQIAELTNHTNIKFVLDPPAGTKPNSSQLRAIERASQLLIDLLARAKEKKNDAFLTIYVPMLFQKLQPLLNNHMYARIEAIIILGKAATPAYLEVFIKQLSDPNQAVWVKLQAAVGISTATSDGRVTLDVQKATAATAALVGFLQKEPNAPWPVKIRVVEALGNLRLPSTATPPGKPDVTAAIMAILADKTAKCELRAWSAWALGMIQMTPSQSYNFGIEAYHMGQLAAEIGDKIGLEYDQNEKAFTKRSDYARYLTGLLIYQVSPALAGESDMANSGLLNQRHSGLAASATFVKGLDEQIKNVIQESVDLLRAGGNEMKTARLSLGKRVAELHAYLDKNPPKSLELFPGGPSFPVVAAAEPAPATTAPATKGAPRSTGGAPAIKSATPAAGTAPATKPAPAAAAPAAKPAPAK